MKKLIAIAILLLIFGCNASDSIECPCVVVASETHGSNYLITVEGGLDRDMGTLNPTQPRRTFQLLSNTQYNIGDTLKFTKR